MVEPATGGRHRARGDTWKLGHRPGLDGLRGIAIALVLLLHWWPARFPGGSIGVDLFFVLSGFLITRLLIEEYTATGRLDLGHFYLRRARRLFPALAVLVVVCATAPGVGWVVLYASNWGRIAGATVHGPLEHTWSLAIEEQFYLCWPLLFLVVMRLRRPLLLVSVLTFVIALHRFEMNANWGRLANGTDVRADSLLIGCLVAFAAPMLCRRRWVLPAAITAVPLAMSVLHEQVLTGWGYTVLALGWAVVLLWAVSSTGWITVAPLRLLGRLSYSAYLWHYPITLTLRGGNMHHTTAGTTLAAIALTGAASWASYRWIEAPFRGLAPPGRRRPARPTSEASELAT